MNHAAIIVIYVNLVWGLILVGCATYEYHKGERKRKRPEVKPQRVADVVCQTEFTRRRALRNRRRGHQPTPAA